MCFDIAALVTDEAAGVGEISSCSRWKNMQQTLTRRVSAPNSHFRALCGIMYEEKLQTDWEDN